MKPALVHSTLADKEVLKKITKTKIIGNSSKAIGYQLPQFKNTPMVFCSYFDRGYRRIYGDSGVIFRTDAPIIYACPSDSFDLMRSGCWLLGHERFVFSSIEEMLAEYPSSDDFKKDFQEYFRQLDPEQMYPQFTPALAELEQRLDYCLRPDWDPRCNEVTYHKPLKIKDSQIFHSREELVSILSGSAPTKIIDKKK